MNRITIDTEDLRGLARVCDAESDELATIRLDLLRAWSDLPPAIYPGIERVVGWGDEVNARLANLAGVISNEASALQIQALRAEDSDILGRLVALLLGALGPLAAAFGPQPLASWVPMTNDTAAMFGTRPLGELERVAMLPSLSTGLATLDPLAALGAQNGALAPISGLLNQVQQVVNNPIGFLDGPQGQALAANNGALVPIQGLLNQTQAVFDNPLGFAALPPSSGSPLANLEHAALQQNLTRILNGGSFPGSDVLGSFRGNFNGLFPGGTDNWLNNLIGSAKANGRFHPGINASAALQGQLAAGAQFSSAVARFNPFQGIIDGNILQSNAIGFQNQLNAQGVSNQAATLRAAINSQFGFNI